MVTNERKHTNLPQLCNLKIPFPSFNIAQFHTQLALKYYK